MDKINELDQEKPPVGSYEAMKPWFDIVDALHEKLLRLQKEGRLERKLDELK
jgi:hypothetical protein